jgi:hypothetical protein
MFVRYFLEMPVDHRRAMEALTREPRDWLAGIAEVATLRGDNLLAEDGFEDETRRRRRVTLEFAPAVHMSRKMVLPMRWIPNGGSGLVPPLDADLEIASLAAGSTQLAISARYVPPAGPNGGTIDRAVLSRVAEATVKDFLDAVGQAIMASVVSA